MMEAEASLEDFSRGVQTLSTKPGRNLEMWLGLAILGACATHQHAVQLSRGFAKGRREHSRSIIGECIICCISSFKSRYSLPRFRSGVSPDGRLSFSILISIAEIGLLFYCKPKPWLTGGSFFSMTRSWLIGSSFLVSHQQSNMMNPTRLASMR